MVYIDIIYTHINIIYIYKNMATGGWLPFQSVPKMLLSSEIIQTKSRKKAKKKHQYEIQHIRN